MEIALIMVGGLLIQGIVMVMGIRSSIVSSVRSQITDAVKLESRLTSLETQVVVLNDQVRKLIEKETV